MNASLAGRMAVWTILAIIAYGLLVLGIGRFMAWLSRFYPRPEPYEDYDDEEMLP